MLLRDGAYNAHALDVAGEHERARAFFDWALRTQEASGCWYQRYDTQGNLAPTWGLIQFDEIGIFVWALGQHVDLTGDVEYARSVWPALKQAGSYMLRELDPETGLAPITKDLWEEFDGISTYACATTWAGFAALARLARLLGTEAEAQQWQEAAARLKQAIEQHLWSEAAGHFLRGGRLKVAPLEGHETTALTADEVAITIRVDAGAHAVAIQRSISRSWGWRFPAVSLVRLTPGCRPQPELLPSGCAVLSVASYVTREIAIAGATPGYFAPSGWPGMRL